MSNPRNAADRISMGIVSTDAHQCLWLLMLASEATTEGITKASSMLLNAWAAEAHRAAEVLSHARQYWGSIADELEHMARERCTGLEK
jgi:hypothetical protein